MQLIAAVYDEKRTQAIKMAVRAGGAALAERSSLDPFWSFLRALFLNLAIVVMIGFPSIVPSLAESCIVVDSDADLDDFRAVITLAPTGQLAAIVITEGIARAHEGAGAMENLLSHAGLVVPVIVGASADRERQYTPDKNLPAWRRAAEQLNGILTNPISPSIQTDGDFVRTLRRLTAKCSTVSLLVIGPWTSFLRYADDLLPKVDRITVQGRAPSLATATPTGRPHTVVSLTTKPVAKSSYSPVGTPSLVITRITLYPVSVLRSQEPCSAAKTLPEYSGGNCCPV